MSRVTNEQLRDRLIVVEQQVHLILWIGAGILSILAGITIIVFGNLILRAV